MKSDVEKIVETCDQCLRNHKTIPIEHPAKATKITGIFDKIGIDLIF